MMCSVGHSAFRTAALLAVAALFICSPAHSQPAELSPDQARESLDECDALFETERDKPEVVDELLERYEQVARCLPDDYDAQWKLARAYWWAAEGTPTDEEMARLGRLAYETGVRAASLAPNRPEGHYYAAAGVGEWSKGMGIVKALWEGLEGKFLDELRAAQKIAPDLFHGGPDRIWCRYHYRLPWPKRDLDESEKHCRMALKKGPRSIRAHLYLADTLEAQGEEDAARRLIEECLQMKPENDYDPVDGRLNHRRCKARALDRGL